PNNPDYVRLEKLEEAEFRQPLEAASPSVCCL
ncbi:hypothetical protein QBC99_005812, partial [Beijerinckia sp. GAS462]|nr:hypothetical protein [Beijerinckia sp. GAS462]